MEREEMPRTTLGDLIVALTEETSQYLNDEREINKVVAFRLTHLLNNASPASRRWQRWQ